VEEREEGGTPAIIESIRAGLVFQLKHSVGVKNILDREHFYTKYEMFARERQKALFDRSRDVNIYKIENYMNLLRSF
jgi:selenocysteine lyase/cysteine desulfurase